MRSALPVQARDAYIPDPMRRAALLIPLLLLASPAAAQVIADLAVHAGRHDRRDVGVTATASIQGPVTLWEVTDGRETATAFDYDGRAIRWIVAGHTPRGTVRTFELRRAASGEAPAAAGVRTTDDGNSLTVLAGDAPVLRYRYTRQPVPDSVDTIFERSGFIHPLFSPEGTVLTQIQPADHWHHYGLWNPWTQTRFRGETIDFWNLGGRQGLVRHAAFSGRTHGRAAGGFRASLDHIVTTGAQPVTALHEELSVQVWSTPTPIIDFISTLSPATDSALTVLAYRYQGLGLRGPETWNDDTSWIRTSEGHARETANATRARWVDVRGVSGGTSGLSGLLLMSHPHNRDHPEPVRIWPPGMHEGMGNVFVNFNPAMERDWVLGAGTEHTLRYRLIPYDGAMSVEDAERLWTDFAEPPAVTVRPNRLEGARVLVYTRNGQGYVHDNIPGSIAALTELGAENGFEVIASEDPALFTEATLSTFDAVVFSNTNNDILETPEQHAALQAYVRGGGGVAGIHSASGSERDWPWFSQLLGGNFERHAPRQDFTVEVVRRDHPSTAFLPARWDIVDDECYYHRELNPGIRVLLAADLTTVDDPDKPGQFADRYPLAWYQTFDGGRQWYTPLGHRAEHYDDPVFRSHLLGGLRWVLSDNPD